MVRRPWPYQFAKRFPHGLFLSGFQPDPRFTHVCGGATCARQIRPYSRGTPQAARRLLHSARTRARSHGREHRSTSGPGCALRGDDEKGSWLPGSGQGVRGAAPKKTTVGKQPRHCNGGGRRTPREQSAKAGAGSDRPFAPITAACRCLSGAKDALAEIRLAQTEEDHGRCQEEQGADRHEG